MSRASRKSTAGGKKKVKPISFEEDEDVETMFMAEVPIVTASLMPSMSNNNMRDPAAKKKSKYFGNDEGVESPEEEDEDEMDNKSVSKFLQKSPSKAKSKNQGHNSSSGNLMASGAAPPNLGREPSLVSSNFQPVKPWPPALRNKIAHSLKGKQNEAGCREFLTRHLWPTGLKEAIIKSCRKLPLRFFIVDDSGSMILNDGRRLVSQGTTARLVKCTRWAELSESMTFMAELSSALGIPSEFRLLNGAEPIIVGLSDDQGESMRFLREVMAESPAGPTPLCMHITGVVQSILSIEKELRANQQKAVVVIATDGESSDGNVAEALRPLTDLPVLVILRLCTEEGDVIQYWNSIDNQLELDIDVIDDQLGDAKQVNDVNGWLTYGEPIHRMREFGASMKEMDIIDESTMSTDQMRMICAYLFCSGDVSQIPHPGVDWKSFISKLKELMAREPKVFCPMTQALKPWIDLQKLNKFYTAESSSGGGGGGCTIC